MASTQVEIVGLEVRLVAASTGAQVQAQGVDDAAGNLVLNREDIGQRAIEPVRTRGDAHRAPGPARR